MASKGDADSDENHKASDEANGIKHVVKDDSVDNGSVNKTQLNMHKYDHDDVKQGMSTTTVSESPDDDDDVDDDDDYVKKEIKKVTRSEIHDDDDDDDDDSGSNAADEVNKEVKKIYLTVSEIPDDGLGSDTDADDNDELKEEMEKTKTQNSKAQEKSIPLIYCNFCQQCASHLCKNCSFYYCGVCLERLHPPVGPFQHHVVTNSVQVSGEDIQLCSNHGLPAKIYCQICKEKKCTECANSTCHLHLQNVISRDEVKREKERLLNDLESLKQKISEIETQVEWDLDKVETTFLLRRERIRQEFASFHDLLFEKESEILKLLEKEKTERQQQIKKGLQEKMTALQLEEIKLTDMVTNVVQERAARKSIQKLFDAQKSGQSLLGEVEECYSQLHNNKRTVQARSLLDSPFTLLKVKQDVSVSLDYYQQDTDPVVTFKQKILFMNGRSTQVPVATYLTPVPSVPPSTYLSYNVQVLKGKREIWSCHTTDIQALVLNSTTTLLFSCGERYLLRLTPLMVSCTGQKCNTTRHLPPTHLLILIRGFSYETCELQQSTEDLSENVEKTKANLDKKMKKKVRKIRSS